MRPAYFFLALILSVAAYFSLPGAAFAATCPTGWTRCSTVNTSSCANGVNCCNDGYDGVPHCDGSGGSICQTICDPGGNWFDCRNALDPDKYCQARVPKGCLGACDANGNCTTSSCPPPPSCTPNCSNASNVCSGTSFGDGCGGICLGTKNCSTPPSGGCARPTNPNPPPGCTGGLCCAVCGDGICDAYNGENAGNCPRDCSSGGGGGSGSAPPPPSCNPGPCKDQCRGRCPPAGTRAGDNCINDCVQACDRACNPGPPPPPPCQPVSCPGSSSVFACGQTGTTHPNECTTCTVIGDRCDNGTACISGRCGPGPVNLVCQPGTIYPDVCNFNPAGSGPRSGYANDANRNTSAQDRSPSNSLFPHLSLFRLWDLTTGEGGALGLYYGGVGNIQYNSPPYSVQAYSPTKGALESGHYYAWVSWIVQPDGRSALSPRWVFLYDNTPPIAFFNTNLNRQCYKPPSFPMVVSSTANDPDSGVQSVTLRLTNVSTNPGTNNILRSASPAGGSTWNYTLKNSDLSAVGGTGDVYKLEVRATNKADISTSFATGPTPNGAYCPAGSNTCQMFKYDDQCIPAGTGTSGAGDVHSNKGL